MQPLSSLTHMESSRPSFHLPQLLESSSSASHLLNDDPVLDKAQTPTRHGVVVLIAEPAFDFDVIEQATLSILVDVDNDSCLVEEVATLLMHLTTFAGP